MAAYAYYVEDDPILPDEMFDRMARRMLDQWDNIEHYHKNLLDEATLKAGTYLGEYPSRVKGAVKSVRETYR